MLVEHFTHLCRSTLNTQSCLRCYKSNRWLILATLVETSEKQNRLVFYPARISKIIKFVFLILPYLQDGSFSLNGLHFRMDTLSTSVYLKVFISIIFSLLSQALTTKDHFCLSDQDSMFTFKIPF